jgi:uncharacterized membrane protein
VTSGHRHAAHDHDDVVVARGPRVALIAALVVVGVATLIGVWTMWPHGDTRVAADQAYSAPGVTFPHADVVAVQPACPQTPSGPAPSCGHIQVRTGGERVSVGVPPEVSWSGLRAGDRVQLARLPAAEGQPATYSFVGTDRHAALFWLALVFALLVVAVARLRGLMAMVALVFSALMITKFMLPALLAGERGMWVAVVGASAIMFVVLYLTHGVSLRTSAALAGTLVGVAVTAGVGQYAVASSRLTGIADEGGSFLSTFVSGLSFTGLLTCGLIVAGLGVLNDVTITQSSAVWELRSAAPEAPRWRIFSGAMRIGRDHISTQIYTITFAYAGASIVVLLLLAVYDRPLLDLMSDEAIAEEIVRTLASGIGLVLAVPITTAIAAAVASPASAASAGTSRRWRVAPDHGDPYDMRWSRRTRRTHRH